MTKYQVGEAVEFTTHGAGWRPGTISQVYPGTMAGNQDYMVAGPGGYGYYVVEFSIRKPSTPQHEAPPDESLAAGFIKALANHTINDISFETMSRISHRLAAMMPADRKAPKRVADVLVQELGKAEMAKLTPEQQKTADQNILGAQKALSYVEKAYANGNIKQKDYFEMRAYLVMPMPREVIPPTLAGINTQQLIHGQKSIQQTFGVLNAAGKELLRKPFEDVNSDIQRMKRAWGIK